MELVFRIPWREWIIAVAIPITDSPITAVDEEFRPAFSSDPSPGINSRALSVVDRGCPARTRRLDGPLPIVGDDMDVLWIREALI